MMDSSDTNSGTIEIVTFVAGAANGIIRSNISFTHKPISAETMLPQPTCSPTTKSRSFAVTPASGTHMHPLQRDRDGVPETGTDAFINRAVIGRFLSLFFSTNFNIF